MCDFTYVVLIEDLEAEVRTQQVVAATFLAQGHEAEMPNLVDVRKRFDDYLEGPLEADVPDEFHERLVLLGLRK